MFSTPLFLHKLFSFTGSCLAVENKFFSHKLVHKGEFSVSPAVSNSLTK